MSRTTIVGLAALILIAAGAAYWRYTGYQEDVRRQKEITRALERTEGDLVARVDALDSIIAAYPEDEMIQRVARYQVLRSHDEMDSRSGAVVTAAESFLSIDSSGAALNYVASVYASHRVSGAGGLGYAQRALVQARAVERPENMTDEQWSEQRRLMVGETLHIVGQHQLLEADPAGARTTLEAAADSVPDSPNVLLTLATVLEELGSRRDALDRYLSVVRLRYEDEPAREGVSRLLPEFYGYRTPVHAVLDTLVANAQTRRKEFLLSDAIGRPLSPVVLERLGGGVAKLDSMGGSAVVLTTWATWCVPCQKLLPRFQAAYDELGYRSDVTFLAVAFDEDRERVAPHVAAKGYTFPVAYGNRSDYGTLGVQGIPTTLYIDPHGVIRFSRLGYSEVGDFIEEMTWQLDALAGVPESESDTPSMGE